MGSKTTPTAVCVVGGVLLLCAQWTLKDPLSGMLCSLIFLTTIFVAGVSGGWKWGVAATIGGVFIAVFLFSPPYLARFATDPNDLPRLSTFLFVGLALSSICEMLKLAWRRIEVRQRQLEDEVKERLKAQLAEKARADELMTTLASIGDGVIKTDADGRITFLNPVAEQLVGRTSNQVKGQPLSDVFRIVDEATRQPVENPAMRALRDGQVIGLTNQNLLISHDGSERSIDDSAAPIKDASGTVTGCVLVFRDVTPKKRIEAEREHLLKEIQVAKDRLDEIFRLAPAFICMFRGPEHVFEMVNERFSDLIGRRDVIGKSVRDAVPEVADQGYFELLDRVYQTGAAFVGHDMRVLLQQDQEGPLAELFVDFVYTAMRDADGVISGILVHGVDVTDRRTAAEKIACVIAESEQQRRMFDTALTNTPDFIYLFDLEGRFTYVNKPLLDLWQKHLSETLNRNFYELGYPPELAKRLHSQIDEVIQTRQSIRDEARYTSAISTRDYEHIFVPVFGTNGEVEAVAGSTRDVTERKLAEAAMQEADRKKDDFIALLAHELRNPLAPLRHGLEIMRLSDEPGTINCTREMMDRQLTHLVRLIDDLLDVSRIGRHKMDLRRERVSIIEIFANAVETARPMIERAGHELNISLPDELVTLDADLTRMSQVLSNLLTNSAKYTERGGHIWLSAVQNTGNVVISVRDDGIGIPSSSLPNIFDMFSQVDRSIEKTTGGLGIGLALVKGLVEMHGGRVTAHSEGQGKGSQFTITLPIDSEDAKEISYPTSGSKKDNNPDHRRILVVDDSRDGAESLKLMLHLMGNEVATAHDGLEAIEVAKQFQPSVILMDVGMPRLNGLDATRRIRQSPWGQSITIIALTGWGQDYDREQSHEAGCDGHLVKPVSSQDLVKILDDISPLPTDGSRV